MNCSEIIYERKMTGSFMILKGENVKQLDEKILLKNSIDGMLKMEKCYINNAVQYWYNISGMQSLDNLCQYNDIKIDFLEKLIVSICSRIEAVENNLVDIKCLMFSPELIYISTQEEQIYFTGYPVEEGMTHSTFQNLMEYMLTKLDHSDPEAVHIAYGIYEKTLNGNYSIADIRNAIVRARAEKKPEKQIEDVVTSINIDQVDEAENTSQTNETKAKLQDKLFSIIEKIVGKEITFKFSLKKKKKKEKSADEPIVIKPTDREDMIEEFHPTVCLSDYREHPQGMLLYEGMENRPNIIIKGESIKIGQGNDADEVINKDTISHFHAIINKENKEFYLEDLNSTNGTFVNDEILPYKQKKQLKINDIVRFADVKYRFV